MDTPDSKHGVIADAVAVILALADADDNMAHEPVVGSGLHLEGGENTHVAGFEDQHIVRAEQGIVAAAVGNGPAVEAGSLDLAGIEIDRAAALVRSRALDLVLGRVFF